MSATANSAATANMAATANSPEAAASATILEQGRIGGVGDVGRGAGKALGAAPAATGFNIDTQDTEANILARTGDAVGFIAFITSGTHQYDVAVYDGYAWQIYNNA